MNNTSLRVKGLLVIVLITFIPLLFAGIINYMGLRQGMIDSATEKTLSQLNSSANNLSAWLAIRRAEVLVISRTDVVRYGKDEEKLSYFNRELVRAGFAFRSLGFVGKDGMAIRTDGTPFDLSNHSFFQTSIKGKVLISDPFKTSLSPKEQFVIAVPVYNEENQIAGIVYAAIDMDMIIPYLQLDKPDAATFWLYNEEGVVLFCSDDGVLPQTAMMNGNLQEIQVNEKLLSNKDGMEIISSNMNEYAVFHSKVDGVAAWHFMLEMPMSDLEIGTLPVLLSILLTLVGSELVIVLLCYLFFANMVNRLKNILIVTEQAAAGQFDAEHLSEMPGDEVGKLSRSVNVMVVRLRRMFERLEAIINQNQYSFVVLDEHYRISYLNKKAEEMIGYKTEEVSGHATPLLFMDMEEIRITAEELREKLGREVIPGLDVLKELRNAEFSYEREWTFIAKNGKRIPVLLSTNGLRDANGKFTGAVGMFLDITDKLQVEKSRNRLLDIVGSAKDLIASVDSQGEMIYINQAGKEMLGIHEEEMDLSSLSGHLSSEMFFYLMNGSELAKQYGYWEGNVEILTKKKQLKHVSLVLVSHHNRRTGEDYFSCIARDISEQKIIQEELLQASQDAAEANAAKGRFLALMSHEIRTPLNGIIGLTQLLKRTGLSYSQKDYVDKISTSSESLLRIINDILDFSKVEAEKIEVELLAFHPEELLGRVADQLSVFMGGKEQFEFLIHTAYNLPSTLLGDLLRLEQVLLNLCINAIKFTKKGHVSLRLEVVELREAEVQLRFVVEDTGIGMSEEQLDRLFQPFSQADGSTTRKYGGTGLGLVISQKLVTLMGGNLIAESKADRGSKFSFVITFPMLEEAPSYSMELGEEMIGQPVWIVEDSQMMRHHWCERLESFEMAPVPFASWKTARERLRRIGAGAMPKLILLDMEMPDMYGAETWLEFHQEAVAAGVKTAVLTTSFGRDEMLQMPEKDRPLALLTKPVTRLAMLNGLRGVLTERSFIPPWNRAMSEVAVEQREGRNAKILLAEDNKINQIVALEMLKERGYEVGLAENGHEVLEMLEREEWHLILMDIHMPEMDGMEATRFIRANPKYDGLPIIAVTANVLRADHEQYRQLGMDDIITKPISAGFLHSVLSHWLNQTGILPVSTLWEDEPHVQPQYEQTAYSSLPVIPGVDLPEALARVNGKLPILMHMLEQFQADYPSFIDRLIASMTERDLVTAKRLVHTLRGAASHLSAYQVANAATELELLFNQEEIDEQEWSQRLTNLEEELTHLLKCLQQDK
ncbi:response regulator [Paenibacillus sp. Leaf72]|uniref:response regulator n=1 Tax=Paenibacillus sp. Leaf72 TaxID=1736234 RepID=UPI0006FA3DCF|nr:response regulator [Paenibacillus sp. Leaf72]KQO18504.1 hypothetical protein ASF12_07840 [Paenibacillus sp. Leaf72]